MANIRFPILIWKDSANRFCACAVHEPEDSAAIALTRSEAINQVKDYFAYIHQKEPWRCAPEFEDATLTRFKLTVRPEHRPAQLTDSSGKKIRRAKSGLFASPPMPLSVACVHGSTSGGLLFAAAPMLGMFFTYNEKDRLKETLSHYVQQALIGRTTEQLSRLLAPPHVELDEVIVPIRDPGPASAKMRFPTLEAVADPISDRDYKTGLARPWQRDPLVDSLTAFFTKEKTSAILVGQSGVGKSALLVEAARRTQRDFTPEFGQNLKPDDPRHAMLANAPLLANLRARLVAGMKYLGQWQERCEAIIAELASIKGVLCVERLLDLLSSGGRDPSASIGAFLIPYIRRGELRLIAEATPEELDACRRLLPGLVDVCRQYVVDPLTGPQTIAALEEVGTVLSHGARITLEPAALSQIYRLFSRFQPYHPMPGPAVIFLAELLDIASTKKLKRIDAEFVLAQFTRKTGLPDWLLRDELPLHREKILAEFERHVIGQHDPIRAAADVILAFKAGINDPRRPLGVLLFAGPTGVGKTELARAVAQFLFGHGEKKDRLVRLDMSELGSGSLATQRLLGSADGEPGPLIREVRRQPFNLILLDEIEKAAPEVFDLLLGLFDEGRLTDRFGRTTTFKSTIIIMTSNLGARSTETFGLSPTPAKSYTSEIAAHFRPEFFNRIDAIVTFNPLSIESMRRIAEKELQALAQREGLLTRKLQLTWTPAVIDHLVEVGFDKRYGARPLQRTIESLITTPLAKRLASKPTRSNTRHIRLDITNNTIRIEGLD